MAGIKYNHLAFSDDSTHEEGRFSSLCLFTFPLKFEEKLRKELKVIFKESGIEHEFKWQKVTDAKYKFAAEKIQTFIISNLNNVRLDILIWDMQDSRHIVPGRDDNKNIARMYYHLVQNVLSKRWNQKNIWVWKPDKQSEINWSELGNCLTGKKHSIFSNLFDMNENNYRKLKIKSIEPVNSHEEIFVQIADYFAGIGSYSYGNFLRYINWKASKNLSIWTKDDIKFSKTEIVRYDLINLLNNQCKAAKLSVALDSTGGFHTHNPLSKINFWFYTPQSKLDKAPKN